MEIVVTGSAAAREMWSRVSHPVESVNALHVDIAAIMVLRLEKILILDVEASGIVNQG